MKTIRLALLLATGALAGRAACAAYLGPLPDSAWGSDGISYVDIGLIANGSDYATASVVLPDGRLVLAGTATTVSTPTGQSDLAIVRLQASTGAPDPAFGGGDGIVTMNLVPSSRPRITRMADGRLLFSAQQTSSTAVFGRLAEDGTPDPTFDQDGSRFVSATTFLDAATTITNPIIAPLAGGKSLIVASVLWEGPPVRACIGVIRLNADGSNDPTFALGAGRVCEAPPYEGLTAAGATSLVVAEDGGLLIAGGALHSGGASYDFAVLRLLAEGARFDVRRGRLGLRGVRRGRRPGRPGKFHRRGRERTSRTRRHI